MAFSIGEYQDIFLEEADEQLQELNHNLLELEKNPSQVNIDTINNIFRTAHSLKSSAAFVGLNDLSDLAHHMENLLQGIRDKTMNVTPDIIDILFKCFDVINLIIESVASGVEPKQDLSAIIEKVKTIGEKSKVGNIHVEKSDKKKEQVPGKKTQYIQSEIKRITEGLRDGKSCGEITILIDTAAQLKWIKIQLIMTSMEKISEIIRTVPDLDQINENWYDSSFNFTILTKQPLEVIKNTCGIDQIIRIDMRQISLSKKDKKIALKFHETETLIDESEEDRKSEKKNIDFAGMAKQDAPQEDDMEGLETGRRKEDKFGPGLKIVKVAVDKLDILMNTVGELVIANSGFFKIFEAIKKTNIEKTTVSEFKNRMDQMSRIAKDLQTGIMKTRMVPIGQVFARFDRPVRDLAKEFKKKVKFEIKGEDTEIDKKVIDVIGEPLLHLIRNSIDHGIELPDERANVGKPEDARVTLNAYQGGNQIFVEVGDDGRGLNTGKIKKVALEKGFATADMLANMDNDEVSELIFRPGFSTTDIITDISGRGVGMNVVKETVNELNGNVRIQTEPGMGTTFILSFPLTLAIIPAIMVKVSSETYAIPLPDVIETIKIMYSDITTIEGREVANLRGEILSLLRLNEFIGIRSGLKNDQKIPVVVVGYGNRKIGIVVDELEGKQEIVIKSLEENYANIEGLAGASILGDGSICLILDISSMINKVVSDEEKLSRRRKLEREQKNSIGDKDNVALTLSEKHGKKEPDIVKGYVLFDDKKEAVTKEKPRVMDDEKIKNFPGKNEVKISKTEIMDEISGADIEKDVKEHIIFEKEKKENRKKIPQAVEEEDNGVAKSVKEASVKPDTARKDQISGPELKDKEIENRVKESLREFRKELEDQVKSTLDISGGDNYILKTIGVKKEDLEKIDVIVNIGIANAAESLSQILDKSISLSIPEVEIIPIKNLPKTLGDVDTVYIGVFMPIIGDIKGTVLFSLSEESGFELIDMLYGISVDKTKKLDSDGESALKEITNIVGTSMINVLAEKINLQIRPDVPTIIHDYLQSTIDSMLIQNDLKGDYGLFMNTYFYHKDDKVLGKLLILTETDSLKKMIEKLR